MGSHGSLVSCRITTFWETSAVRTPSPIPSMEELSRAPPERTTSPCETSRSLAVQLVPSKWSRAVHRQYEGTSVRTKNRSTGLSSCRLDRIETSGLTDAVERTELLSILSRAGDWKPGSTPGMRSAAPRATAVTRRAPLVADVEASRARPWWPGQGRSGPKCRTRRRPSMNKTARAPVRKRAA
jgi:hypothetical protein